MYGLFHVSHYRLGFQNSYLHMSGFIIVHTYLLMFFYLFILLQPFHLFPIFKHEEDFIPFIILKQFVRIRIVDEIGMTTNQECVFTV